MCIRDSNYDAVSRKESVPVWFRLATVSTLIALLLVQSVAPCDDVGCECEQAGILVSDCDQLIPEPLGVGRDCPCCPTTPPTDAPGQCPFCSGAAICNVFVVAVAVNTDCGADVESVLNPAYRRTCVATPALCDRVVRPHAAGVRLLV